MGGQWRIQGTSTAKSSTGRAYIRRHFFRGICPCSGVLTQLIARRIDVSRVKKPLFKSIIPDFFFHEKDNFEFYYDEGDEIEREQKKHACSRSFATMLGAATLSNVYQSWEFDWVRHLSINGPPPWYFCFT